MVDITLLEAALQLVANELEMTKLATMCFVNHELHTTFARACRYRQRGLLKQLDQAEGGGRWAWIHPPKCKCFAEFFMTHGNLVRLMLRDDECSVFRDLDSFLQFRPLHHGTYLLRDDEVRIRWVGAGNGVGGWVSGNECEEMAMREVVEMEVVDDSNSDSDDSNSDSNDNADY